MVDNDSHNIKRFTLSWHYKYLIMPMIVGLLTFGLFQKSLFPHHRIILPILCLYIWWAALFTAYKIEIENRNIRFFRIIGKIEVQVDDVEKIDEGLTSIKISHKKGKVSVTSLIDNFSGLLSTIKSLNPDIVEKKV
jgi:hypothetical protein